MTRVQRRRHLLIWCVLGPLMFLGIIAAIIVRRPAGVAIDTRTVGNP